VEKEKLFDLKSKHLEILNLELDFDKPPIEPYVNINNIAEQNSKITHKISIAFADWIAENWVFDGGRIGWWNSIETTSKSEPKYLVDSTEELFNIFLKNYNEK
jgi:hypothetical protein